MEKGTVLDLPMNLNGITVGLGWDVDDGACDLDVSAVLFDAHGADIEAVFFGRLESVAHGIKHTGDNLTGEGSVKAMMSRLLHSLIASDIRCSKFSLWSTSAQQAENFRRLQSSAAMSSVMRAARVASLLQRLHVKLVVLGGGSTPSGFLVVAAPIRIHCHKSEHRPAGRPQRYSCVVKLVCHQTTILLSPSFCKNLQSVVPSNSDRRLHDGMMLGWWPPHKQGLPLFICWCSLGCNASVQELCRKPF